ncbi:cytochrome P450 [Bacillus sp. FJAT-45037]|uniref:cytochrome P450 n=1 Tax=Bacillus sp. FJAT-45037 TaxID=2011007 RepID=UPI000C24020C|nr:cytochrome P450 [Bacillus sp. FJAT-45037]
MKNRLKAYKKAPGPKGHWLTGSLRDFKANPLQFLTTQAEEFGPISKFRFGPQHVYFINDPDLIKEILVTKQKSFTKSRDIQMLKTVVGEGLLTSEKDVHMKQRRLIQPAFKKNHIIQYAQDMIDTTSRYVEDWQDGTERNITNDMMSIALGIITKTMFNMEIRTGADLIEEPMDTVMRLGVKRMRSIFPLPLWAPTETNKKLKQAVAELDHILFSIINERRLESGDHTDLLGILMSARDEEDGSGMSDTQLRDELMTIFLAGHETTANLLSWTFYLLSEHPEVDQKLYEEISEVTNGGPITPEHFMQLPYAQHVISESMRLYPPAYVIGRQVEQDVEIGPYLLRKGSMVLMSQYVMHRNPTFYKDPDAFVPERFENNFLKKMPAYAYFPFGGGPRVCIGNHFAMMEATLALACIVEKYRLTIAPDHHTVKPQPLVTLRPKKGLSMNVHQRR